MNLNFEKLIQRAGGFSLPYLIHLYNTDKTINLYYVNNNENVIYKGINYTAAAFKYSTNATEQGFNGGGTLEISTKENNIIELINLSRNVLLDVIGAINENNEVTEIKAYKHNFGKVSVTRTTAVFKFDPDDRLKMTFPTLIWSNLNNRGNS